MHDSLRLLLRKGQLLSPNDLGRRPYNNHVLNFVHLVEQNRAISRKIILQSFQRPGQPVRSQLDQG